MIDFNLDEHIVGLLRDEPFFAADRALFYRRAGERSRRSRVEDRLSHRLDRSDRAYTALTVEAEIDKGKDHQAEYPTP